MSSESPVAELARRILSDLTAALEAGEDIRRERRGIGVRLRALLTLTESARGARRQVRLRMLAALGRTEVADQVRRGGSCHTGAERSIEFRPETDFESLADGLRQLIELGDEDDE